MRRTRIVLVAALALGLAAAVTSTGSITHAQSPAASRGDAADAAVAALITEVRGLRADLAAASRNQLRAQLLLGRVQMQEQRLAYLDKQRSDAAAQRMAQSQVTSMLKNQMGMMGNGCAAAPSPEQKRDCEGQSEMFKRQLADQEGREQQLRTLEGELTDALSSEQARWSDFNSRLDELERTLR